MTAAEHYLSSSNYMDCISSLSGSNGCSLHSSLKGSDLPELFSNLGLGKYTDVFQQQEVEGERRSLQPHSGSLSFSQLLELVKKQTKTFRCLQIDLQTFLTLTDQDLKELGITTFGARRKMLLAISGTNRAEVLSRLS